MRAPYLDDGDVRLYLGDCIEVMAEMDAESVDAVVCDPPYGLEFMGKEWDAPWRDSSRWRSASRLPGSHSSNPTPRPQGWGDAGAPFAAWCETWAREALRVLKPGGHLLAFGGTRTFHRLTCGIEDAGFEIRDCLSWLYGSGFPKSLDVSKAIDKQRHDRDEVLEVANWLAPHVKRIGVKVVAEAMGVTPTMVSQHWCSHSQTAVPTLEQIDQLLAVLKVERDDVPERIATLIWELNGRKGQPGDAWFQREVTGQHDQAAPGQIWNDNYGLPADLTPKEIRDNPATDAAREWQGWGTALKPGWEPCVVARKPLAGTVAANVQQHGTGALNIDGCRIAGEVPSVPQPSLNSPTGLVYGYKTGEGRNGEMSAAPGGRWPANVALDEQAAAMLDAQSGERQAGAAPKRNNVGFGGVYTEGTSRAGVQRDARIEYQSGGASRFYYTAKASRADRNTSGATNTHPTVKPTDLMRWLVRLVTPPGGVVLDPFAGSGSTLVAARAEGFRAIGIEREEEYAAIIADRLSQLSLFSEAI